MSRGIVHLQPRLRFPDDRDTGFGPGKAELLRLIAATGSIRSAAAKMAMSYSRAWTLVRESNALFRSPLVASARGGSARGGAKLTPLGREVLVRYARMERACHKATRGDWNILRRMLA